jgi:hypothetical protein
MNFITRQQQTDEQKIQDIITALETYSLGDIEHNIKTKKPVAAFILASCWIDQAALFVYNHNEENLDQHYKNFIKTYLNKYLELDLYTNLRCKLVHSYSVGSNMRIATEDEIFDNHTLTTNANFITAKTLHKDLKQAWEKVKHELLTVGSNTRENALKRFDISPTIIEVKSQIYSYNKDEADFLINYYRPLLKGKLLNGKKNLSITSLIKEPFQQQTSQYLILVVVKKSDTKRHSDFLERVTQQFNLPFPIDVLQQRSS